MANNLFTSMMLQLHSQSALKVSIEKELAAVKQKLDQTNKLLAQKELLIGSLELDLEHMVDHLSQINYTTGRDCAKKQWISRALPGLNHEVNIQRT